MGILRCIFALSILLFHSGPLFHFSLANEFIAVCSFFIISGFYMALILDTKYKNIPVFWLNRALRIYPLYYLILLITFTLTGIQFLFQIGNDNAISHYVTYTTHTSVAHYLFGVVNFIIRNLSLIFTTDYLLRSDNTGGYLLVQQAWSLQIELLFYLFVPFIMKLGKKFLLPGTIIYAGFFYLLLSPFSLIPSYTLTYTFLSYVLFFLLGMCSYIYIFKALTSISLPFYVPSCIAILSITYVLLYNSISFRPIPAFSTITDPFYYLILTISLPFIFLLTRKSIFDRYIGALSYPIYISHFLIIKLLANTPYFQNTSTLRTCVTIIVTLAVSIALIHFVEKPIERYRQRKFR